MDQAAASQTVRNWKLLSRLKDSAESIQIRGEEAGVDFSLFSKKTLGTSTDQPPVYERMINRIRINPAARHLRKSPSFLSLMNMKHWFVAHNKGSRLTLTIIGFIVIVLTLVLVF